MTIIYVEEDLFFAEGVKRLFNGHGLKVIHTTKADQVSDLIQEHTPSAVLFDLRLTHLNGFELLQALREDPRTKDIPLMIWSQLASQEDIRRCFALGACEYFLKGQHHPNEVARHITKRFRDENGFTLPEWMSVLALFFIGAGFILSQVNRVLDLRRDDGQLVAVKSDVSAIVAAKQERAMLVHCTIHPDIATPLFACKLCKEESCQNALPVPWTFTPVYERSVLDPEHGCTTASVAPCHVSIEQDGIQPVSTDAFKLRFFLARTRDGLKGGQTHTINENGVIE